MIDHAGKNTLNWYLWPLVPFMFVAGLFAMALLGLIALLSVPYFFVNPHQHAHVHDFDGTPHQRKRLAMWRRQWARLGVFGRLARCIRTWRRCRGRRSGKSVYRG